MIDTLKLSKRLQAVQFSKEQAEALAEGLSESLREDYVTREHLDSRLGALGHDIDARLARLKTELIIWMIGLLMAQSGLLWAVLHK